MWTFSIVDEKPEKIEKVKEDGPPADPSTAKISSNKESIIEINANNKGLGLFVTGGKMIQPPVVSNMLQIETICMSNSLLMKKSEHLSPQDGAYVVYIYPNGAANIDKRLQIFDKIIEVEGKKITADMSYSDLKKIFKRRYLVVSIVYVVRTQCVREREQ